MRITRFGKPARRGWVAVQTLVYVTMFGMLSVAYVAATNVNLVLAARDRSDKLAYAAAESGVAFLRSVLANLDALPTSSDPNLSDSDAAAAWGPGSGTIIEAISNAVNGTGNMLDPNGPSRTVVVSGASVIIPPVRVAGSADPASFEARMAPDAADPKLIHATITGRHNDVTRAIRFDYNLSKDRTILTYGVASMLRVMIGRNVIVEGDIYTSVQQVSPQPPILLLPNFDVPPELAALLADYDTNGDNRLTEAEYGGAAPFATLDATGDGYVDSIDYFLTGYDADGDGRVSAAEHTGDPQLFELYDTNGDGYIDPSELLSKVRPNPAHPNSTGGLYVTGGLDPLWQGYENAVRGTNGGAGYAPEIEDLGHDSFDTSAYKAMTTVPNVTYDYIVNEDYPYDTTDPRDNFNRPVFQNKTFDWAQIPKGTNGLFVNCTFNGVTFVETQYNSTMKSKTNNVRFDGCTFNGPIVSDVPDAFRWTRNALVFTGQTRFYNTVLEESTILTPNFNVDMGGFSDPGSNSKLTGIIVAGIFDVRGEAEIDGTILTMCDPLPSSSGLYQYNTTIGFFDDAAGDVEGEIPAEGWGKIRIKANAGRSLPYGISSKVVLTPIEGSYREL